MSSVSKLGLGFLGLFLLSMLGCKTDGLMEQNLGTREQSAYCGTSKTGYGCVLKDNPIILSGNESWSSAYPLNGMISSAKIFDDYQPTLVGSCQTFYRDLSDIHEEDIAQLARCYRVLQYDQALPIGPSSRNGAWAFGYDTDEFLQVSSFYHTKLMAEYFHQQLVYYLTDPASPRPGRDLSSIPNIEDLVQAKTEWNKNTATNASTLTVYANTAVASEAYFKPSAFSVYLGHINGHEEVLFAQDPTIIYHEVAHALMHVMLNMRNPSGIQTQLGHLYYDEAGALGEGLADYFSYVMTERTHLGEWALGRFLNISRPMSEDDDLHAGGIAPYPYARVSYPAFLNYEPNNHSAVVEDVHNAGMIISHFMTALNTAIIDECHLTDTPRKSAIRQANEYLFYPLLETLAYLGDLNSRGINRDATTDETLPPKVATARNQRVNLNPDQSLTWMTVNNPINFRNFMQTFARKFKDLYFDEDRKTCQGYAFSQTAFENLLDQYGLLLFNHYNDQGNLNRQLAQLPLSETENQNTLVDLNQRAQSALVHKAQISFPPESNATQAYVFDKRVDMYNVLKNLHQSWAVTSISDLIPDDLRYNNGNSRISPGEFVGISLNLYNQSNTALGGVQVLANDWDQGKIEAKTAGADLTNPYNFYFNPCNNLGDGFPVDEAGAALPPDHNTPQVGDCSYTTRHNGDPQQEEGLEQLAPVCWVQYTDENATIWADQYRLKEKLLLPNDRCLDRDNPHNCFVRAVGGAESAFFSQIKPHQTWGETIIDNDKINFTTSNIIFFEINPWTPPGTTFNCRFRVRFSNCLDCYQDPQTSDTQIDDYADYEYAGPRPFKLLNLQFTVID